LLSSFRKFAAGFHLRMLRRKFEPVSFSLPDDLTKVKNILVCLPPGQRQLTMVKDLLPELTRIFDKSEIYLMGSPGRSVYDIFPRKGYRIMTPTSGHVSWSGLASKSYIELLKQNTYDLILDLNLYPNRFAQSILLSFPEAIRIGNRNSLGVPHYNIEIKTRFVRDEKKIYRSILDTIDNLKNHAQSNNNIHA
jgi:hypothetical protein